MEFGWTVVAPVALMKFDKCPCIRGCPFCVGLNGNYLLGLLTFLFLGTGDVETTGKCKESKEQCQRQQRCRELSMITLASFHRITKVMLFAVESFPPTSRDASSPTLSGQVGAGADPADLMRRSRGSLPSPLRHHPELNHGSGDGKHVFSEHFDGDEIQYQADGKQHAHTCQESWVAGCKVPPENIIKALNPPVVD
jgi:hypothetical protein